MGDHPIRRLTSGAAVYVPPRVLLVSQNAEKIVRVQEALADEAAIENVPGMAEFGDRLQGPGKPKPDLILLDLPPLDSGGRQLLHEVCSLSADVPIIALTGNNEPEIDDRVVDQISARELTPEVLPRAVRYSVEYQRSQAHERQLSVERDRLRLALRASNAGVWEYDPKTHATIWSDEMLSIYGLTRQQAPGSFEGWIASIVPADRELARAAHKRSVQTATVGVDFRIRRRDNGEERWLHGTGVVYFDQAGAPARIIGINIDITERKRAEAALHQKNQQLESLLKSAPLGVAFFDREHRYVEINEILARINGIAARDHIGRRIEELLRVNAKVVVPVIDRIFATGDVVGDFEIAGETPREPGVERHWLTGFYPVRDAAGAVAMVGSWVAEITALKRTEAALRASTISAERAKGEAEEANQAKDRFLATLSHELRTPLTPVVAAVELLQRRPGLTPEARVPLDIIRRNVQLQARLIDDLLDLTRIANGKLELKKKRIDLMTVVERAVEIVKPDIDARRLHFGVECTGGPLVVYADASRIQQVIWNLLTNAVKFTPDGGCVGLRCDRVAGHAVIEVNDSGIGIEPGPMERLFDAFEQGGRGITRQFGGLGLGLAIAKRLVQMHGGTITVHSEGMNRGATFRVALPLAGALPEEAQPRTAPAEQGYGRILLVEDNGDTAFMMKMLLETLGYRVETAGDVKQALQAIEAQPFDLLISDLGLPDGSGIELIREIRQRGHALKAIALSGYGQEDDVRRSKDAGFTTHLVKPVDAELLMETVTATADRDD